MQTVDGRCFCSSCEARTSDIYRMVGVCCNCGAKPILMLFRAGDRTHSLNCPACGNRDTVQAQRLATPDEIPAPSLTPEAEQPKNELTNNREE